MTTRGKRDPVIAQTVALVRDNPNTLGPVLEFARNLLQKRQAERKPAKGE